MMVIRSSNKVFKKRGGYKCYSMQTASYKWIVLWEALPPELGGAGVQRRAVKARLKQSCKDVKQSAV